MNDLLRTMMAAAASEVGIEVRTSDVESYQARFYAARTKARSEGNFSFDSLRLRPISSTVLFVFHKERSKDDGEEGCGEGNNPPIPWG